MGSADRRGAWGILIAAALAACAAGNDEPTSSTGSGGAGAGGPTGSTTTAGTGGASTTATTGSGGDGGTGTTSTGQGGGASSSSSSSSSTTSGGGGAPPADGEVWGHSDTVLYKLNPATKAVTTVGTFDCISIALPGSGEGMWDLALDKNGAMYGTSMSILNGGGLVTIDKVNAHCVKIASGDYPNSLTFVPEGTLDPVKEVLVGFKGAQYVRIDPQNGAQQVIGNLNPNPTGQDWESSGDVVSLIGGQTYLTVKPLGSGANYAGTDRIVELDPVTGQATSLIGDTTYPKLWGLGYWAGTAYGFSATGQLIAIDLGNAMPTAIPLMNVPANLAFWGAGVTTAAPHM